MAFMDCILPIYVDQFPLVISLDGQSGSAGCILEICYRETLTLHLVSEKALLSLTVKSESEPLWQELKLMQVLLLLFHLEPFDCSNNSEVIWKQYFLYQPDNFQHT